MSLDRRGVDQQLRRWPAGRGQSGENLHPDAFSRPSHKPVVQRLLRTVDDRRINPATAGFQHVHDAADDPAVIDPACRAYRLKGTARAARIVPHSAKNDRDP